MHTNRRALSIAKTPSFWPAPAPAYSGPTYYGLSPVKASKYGALVWGYTFIAGLAGSAQIVSTVASLLRGPQWKGVIRNGRYIAAAGSAIGGVLLIADLHTPRRWYNMLRIYRPTSPMSLGTYVLSSFGMSSGVAAASSLLANKRPHWLRSAARMSEIPAAIAGAGMSTYTGALLAATSTPLWAVAPRLMTARFACSSMAAAAAALSAFEQLGRRAGTAATLDRLALVATLADAALAVAADREYRGTPAGSTLRGRKGLAISHHVEKGLEHALPLACYGWNTVRRQPSRRLSIAAAVGVLAGGLLMRATLFKAGNRSASRPQDAFGWTQSAR